MIKWQSSKDIDRIGTFCLKCHCNRDGNFCSYCGEKLVAYPSDCACGNCFLPTDYFCKECGEFIENLIGKQYLLEE